MKKTHIDYPINDDTLYRLADLFKVFGDPTRIRILYVLSVEELCVQDIADRLFMTQSAISHQLRVLKQMSLVKFRSLLCVRIIEGMKKIKSKLII